MVSGVSRLSSTAYLLPIEEMVVGASTSIAQCTMSSQWTPQSVMLPPPWSQNQRQVAHVSYSPSSSRKTPKRFGLNGCSGAGPSQSSQSSPSGGAVSSGVPMPSGYALLTFQVRTKLTSPIASSRTSSTAS